MISLNSLSLDSPRPATYKRQLARNDACQNQPFFFLSCRRKLLSPRHFRPRRHAANAASATRAMLTLSGDLSAIL